MSTPSPWPRRLGVALAAAVGVVGSIAGGVYFRSESLVHRSMKLHEVDFPVPFPLSEAERAALMPPPPEPAPVDPAAPALPEGEAAPPPPPPTLPDFAAIARAQAIERGRHLVAARYACLECHGADLGGGKMVDDAMIGQLYGPNLTSGAGSRTQDYTVSDWDRTVRHGVRRDGRVTPMPSKDFFFMSDRELSDIIAYISSLPPVDREVPPITWGPLGRVLVATGAFEFSADVHPGHEATHIAEPPPEAPDATFGKHLAYACTGCHRLDFKGGPIAGGPPDWPAPPDFTGGHFKDWTYAQFVAALREAKRPDGTPLKEPMISMGKIAKEMTDTELQALFAYFQTL